MASHKTKFSLTICLYVSLHENPYFKVILARGSPYDRWHQSCSEGAGDEIRENIAAQVEAHWPTEVEVQIKILKKPKLFSH